MLRTCHQLSGGQLQRLLIARALLLDIKILIADEIISMLDASTRVDVLNLLADLKTRGLGVLFITHDLSLGNYISERTIILRRGVIVEMGATSKVFDNPQHEYTKMLLASVPQLHKKWEPQTNDTNVASNANGSAAADSNIGMADPHERYSRSSLHPLVGRAHTARGRKRQASASGDGGGYDGSAKTDAYLRSNERLPQLVEVEDDHYVARPVVGN
jgi:ABC-type oligopeptide transport system ATPase subunit